MSKTEKEKAYQYDLLIVPTWRNAFELMVNEQVGLPREGRVLVINCGTGGHSLEIAAQLQNKGEVVGIDPNEEHLALARAKALAQRITNATFEFGEPPMLDYDDESFDWVIADASMMTIEYDVEEMAGEILRVLKSGGTAALQLATRGSFDEFFSVYWEALHECGLEEFSPDVEGLITERPTISEAEALLKQAGLKKPRTFSKKQEFLYDNAEQFLTSPIIEDVFFDNWMEVLPDSATTERVRHAIERIIERERRGHKFDVSIKATVIWGQKD